MNTLMAILIAVLNSLWEAALLAGLVWLAMRFAPRVNAATRFAVWWAVLAVVVSLPAVPRMIFVARQWFEPKNIAASLPRYAPAPAPAPVVDLPPLVTVAENRAVRWPVWLAAGWALLFAYGVAKMIRSYLYLRAVKRRAAISSESLPPTGRAAALLVSPEIDSPIAAGFVRPAVILPDSLHARLSQEEMRCVVLHESAHLARWDDWTNLFARLLRAALLLHPVALWILHRIEIEREAACDEWVVERTHSARRYAETLLRLYELRFTERQQLLAMGIFGQSSRLTERIEMLVRRGRDLAAGVSVPYVVASAAAVIGIAAIASLSPAWIALAQRPRPGLDVASTRRHTEEDNTVSFAGRRRLLEIAQNIGPPPPPPAPPTPPPAPPPPPRKEFDAASIKPADPSINGWNMNTRDGVFMTQGAPLLNLIQTAFGAKPNLISGPAWLSSVRFDVQAKSSDPSGRDMNEMLRNLLTDRFGLKVHRERMEKPVYTLVIARGGLKMEPDPGNDLHAASSSPGGGKPVGSSGGGSGGGGGGSSGTGGGTQGSRGASSNGTGTMQSFVDMLSRHLDRPVLDRTGESATYKWNLSGFSWPGEEGSQFPSIFTVLPEQLGLRLESGRGMVEILVIDNVERTPTEN